MTTDTDEKAAIQGVVTVSVRIEGEAPLLQQRFAEPGEVEKRTRRVQIATVDPRKEAEKVEYRDNDGNLYHPSAAITRLLREAGSAHKQRGSRKSLKYIIPAAVRTLSDTIPLLDLEGNPLTTYEVDGRPVTIPATKGRIMRYRPRHNSWTSEFDLVINETVLDAETVHMLLEEGGRQIGIGDYRPEKGGPFGVFAITSWERRDID